MQDTLPQIEHIGTVVIPVSQWKLGQLFLWLQRKAYQKGEECPIDISMFPESQDLTQDSLTEDGTPFHSFREIRFEHGPIASDLPKIMCVFDRMRFVPSHPETKVTPHLNQNWDKEHMAVDAQQILKDEHGIVINLGFLQEAVLGGSIYAESVNAEDLVHKVLATVKSPTLHTTGD